MNFRCILALLLTVPFLSIAATTSTADVQQRLHGAVDEAISVVVNAPSRAALVERLRPVLEKHISFATMTKRAVGPGWRQFTPAQQQKATQLFTTLIIRSYSNKFTIGERPVVSYQTAVAPADGRVDVPSTIVYQGSRYSVIYRMDKSEDWRVTDVVIEGVSLVANYRSQLDAEFKKGGADTVLSSLTRSVSRPQ